MVGLLTAAAKVLFFIAVVATGVSIGTVVCLGFAPVLLLAISCIQRRRLTSADRPSRSLFAEGKTAYAIAAQENAYSSERS